MLLASRPPRVFLSETRLDSSNFSFQSNLSVSARRSPEIVTNLEAARYERRNEIVSPLLLILRILRIKKFYSLFNFVPFIFHGIKKRFIFVRAESSIFLFLLFSFYVS